MWETLGMTNTAFSLPPAETRFVGTAPLPSGKCASCNRKVRHFYRLAGGQTRMCIRCIESALKVIDGQGL
jgi:hypothetical protein